jgi:hypothetical protein
MEILVVLTERSVWDPGVMHGRRKSSFDLLRPFPQRVDEGPAS